MSQVPDTTDTSNTEISEAEFMTEFSEMQNEATF